MRPIAEQEYPLIACLFECAGLVVDLGTLKVQPMTDEGRGVFKSNAWMLRPHSGDVKVNANFSMQTAFWLWRH